MYVNCLVATKKSNVCVLGFGSESDEVESEGAGGLESDEEEEDKERLMNAKEGIESEDDKLDSRKRTNSEEGGSQRKKKKSRQIVESDEDSDWKLWAIKTRKGNLAMQSQSLWMKYP